VILETSLSWTVRDAEPDAAEAHKYQTIEQWKNQNTRVGMEASGRWLRRG
jgi:hypothetical protein